MKRLKAVIIGSGLIAKLKHIPAFRKHRDKLDLAAICELFNCSPGEMLQDSQLTAAFTRAAELIGQTPA